MATKTSGGTTSTLTSATMPVKDLEMGAAQTAELKKGGNVLEEILLTTTDVILFAATGETSTTNSVMMEIMLMVMAVIKTVLKSQACTAREEHLTGETTATKYVVTEEISVTTFATTVTLKMAMDALQHASLNPASNAGAGTVTFPIPAQKSAETASTSKPLSVMMETSLTQTVVQVHAQ